MLSYPNKVPVLFVYSACLPTISAPPYMLLTDHFTLKIKGEKKPSQNEGEKKPAGLGRVSEY